MKRHNGHNGHGHSHADSVANPPKVTPRVMEAGQAELQKAARVARQVQRNVGNVLSGRIEEALSKTRATQTQLEKYIAFTTGGDATDAAAVAGSGLSATAVGPKANAYGQSATALGGNTLAGYHAVAIGTRSEGTQSRSSGVGFNALAKGESATAVGAYAVANGTAATALGEGADAYGSHTIAIGFHAISNRGGATDGKGNVVVGANALVDNTGAGAVAIGRSAKVDAANGYPGVLGTGSIAMGDSAIAYGNNSTAIGSSTYSAHTDSIALGRGAKTGTTALGVGNIAIGAGSLIKSADGGAIVIGRNATIPSGGGQTGIRAIALGDSANAGGDDSTAIGSSAQASQLGAVALGNNAKALTTSGVAIGEGSLADRAATVSIGNRSSSLTRQLVNVKAGTQADDAVVVSQLQPVVTALGGGASIDPSTGAVTGPTYTLANGGVQTTLSGALGALDKALSDSSAGNPYVLINSTGPKGTASGSNGIAIGQEAYALGNNSVAIGMSSMADQANTFSVGNAAAKRKVVSVAAGDVSAASSDAIVGSQLYATNQAVDQLKATVDGSGLIDPGTGQSLAVTYTNVGKNTIMLGNSGSPVEIMNVADAVVGGDAVNLNQLNSAVDELRIELGGNVKYLVVNSTGAQPTATGMDAVALGTGAIATMDGTLAFGPNARVSAADAVALGSNSLADAPLSISVGNQPAGLKRRIVNMEAGTGADDAVSVSQLQPMVTALGGGAAIDPATGAVTGPTYTLANGGVQTTLDGALSALDQALSDGGASNPYLAVNSAGPDAIAAGTDAVGIGSSAIASGGQSVALGAGSVADQDNSVSLGNPSLSRKIVWVAAGDISAASMDAVNGSQLYATDQAVSDLQNALTGSGLIDPGTGASLAVTYSNAAKNIVLMGNLGTPVEIMNVATGLAGTDAVNLDQLNTGLANLSNQFADNLKYVKVNATGTGANAGTTDSVAIGSSANATMLGAVAIGTGARASSLSSVAIGQNSVASQPSTVSVGNPGGERKIVNVAAGDISIDSTDAINGSQLFTALSTLGTMRNGVLDVTAPLYAIEGVEGDNLASLDGADINTYTALAFGVKSMASGADAASFGLNCIAQSYNAVAVGSSATTGAGTPYSVAFGSDAATTGTQAIALGAHVQANADNALAIGNNNTWALGVSSIAIGDGAKDRGASGVAIGKGALAATGTSSVIAIGTLANIVANVSDAIALGTSAKVAAGANGGVALGQGAVADRGTAVSLGSATAGTKRQIINVAAGTQAADAVNVSQLQGVTTALGGGASVAPDGSITPPSYTIDGTTYASVGTALTAVANMAGTDPNAVAYDSAAKDTVTLGGSSGTVLTNLNAGAVNATSKDAINGAQLFGTAGSLVTALGGGATVNPDGTISAPVYVIDGTVANDVGTAFDTLATAVDNQLIDSGLMDPDTGRTIVAVTYDGASQSSVTLGGTSATSPVTVSNVAAGALSATSTDAVNGSQLYATNQAVSDLEDALTSGGVIDPSTGESLAVTYADASKSDITLGNSGTPVAVSNVAPGALAATSTDVVNGSQLYATDQAISDLEDALTSGGVIDPATGESLAVTYADASKTDISLGAVGTPVAVSNVAPGALSSTSTDVVNGSQLYATNQIVSDLEDALTNGGVIDPSTGESLAVTYVDASKSDITLGNSGTPVAVSNVAPGALAATSTDVVNGSQLYATNQTVGNLDQAVSDLKDALDNGGVLDPATGQSLAVTYTDVSKTDITLGTVGRSVAVSNVAPGTLAATSTDVVNGSQLYATNQTVGNLDQAVSDLKDALTSGGVIDPATGDSLAVTYADATKTDVTLGTLGTPVAVSNVAQGVLTATSTDVVNGSQLYTTNQAVSDLEDALTSGGVIDPATGASLAVTYADATKTDVTLGTVGTPVAVSNVAQGVLAATSTDVVNGSQLFATNQTVSDLEDALTSGGVIDPATGASLAVTYADASKTDITLGAPGTPVAVSNVAQGVLAATSTDVVNGSQLYATNQTVSDLKDALTSGGVIDPATGDSLAVTYTDTSKTGIALGSAGTPVAVSNVAPGALSSTSTDVVNGSQLYATNQTVSNLEDVLTHSGLIDPSTGQSLAVTYDDASKDGVTLGGAGATTPVPLHNMATGTANTDGVNVAQLTNGLTTLKDELANGAIDLKYIKVSSTGTQANANGTDAVSIGAAASATAANSAAIGSKSRASGINAVAIGYNSFANQNNVVSVGYPGGERKIINLDDGDVSAGSTDAINGGQLYAVRQALNVLAGNLGANGVKDVTGPLAAIEGLNGNNIASLNGGNPEEASAAAIGVFSMASGTSAIAVGLRNVAGSDYSVALGRMAQTGADQEYSVAVGSDVHTSAPRAVAFGTRVQANGEHALALGSNETWAIGRSSIAMGDGAKVRGENGIAIGRSTMVVADAIGGVALGHGAVADRGNAISIGGGSIGTRQITHVSAGTEPTDAVNVAQLNSVVADMVARMMAEIQQLRSQLGARASGA